MVNLLSRQKADDLKPEKYHFVYGHQMSHDVDENTVRRAQAHYALFMSRFDLRPWSAGSVEHVLRELPLHRFEGFDRINHRLQLFHVIGIGAYKTKFMAVVHPHCSGINPIIWAEENAKWINDEANRHGMNTIGYESWIHPDLYTVVGFTKFNLDEQNYGSA